MSVPFTAVRVGNQRKLVSAKGTLLGHITITPTWDEILAARGAVEFFLAPEMPLRPFDHFDLNNLPAFTVHRGTIFRQHLRPEWPDGVHLWGVSIEQFEAIPGCAFYPGAAYLRSLIE